MEKSISASQCTNAQGPLRVLLAEDDKINQILAVKILEKEGFDVTVANNGIEAVEAVRENDYDVVLMDVQMPDMDGYTATKKIRQMEAEGVKNQRISIIAMTAHASLHDRETSISAGMDSFLSKPMNREILMGLIQELITSGRENNEL